MNLQGILSLILAFSIMVVMTNAARAQCTNPAGVAGEEFYNFSEKVFQYCNGDDWVAMICNNEPDIEPADCSLPWGGTILHNANVTAYQNATEPFGGSCVAESRACNNGALSGSYVNQNCSVSPPADCTAPWGATISHGSDVLAYQNATEPFGGSCTSESRTCNNGALGGSYTNQACTVNSGDPCDVSPTPGTVCADGTVYAGITPDGDVKMFTTPADAGSFVWIDGAATIVDTAMVNCSMSGTETSCTTGKDNTDLLISLGETSSPLDAYLAAEYCNSLNGHGRNDWYLPSMNELKVLRMNSVAIGNFDLSGASYWSSSELGTTVSYTHRFSDGGNGSQSKPASFLVRCVRKDDPCANSPTPGTTCANGTIYAGSHNGNMIFTTPSDQGQAHWNNGTSTFIYIGANSITDGDGNTTLIGNVPSPHDAAQSCIDLNFGARSDWYLPSITELSELHTYRVAIGGFNSGSYWSSSEFAPNRAMAENFSTGLADATLKDDFLHVRCISKN